MGEHRSRIGAALLGCVAVFTAAALTPVATDAARLGNPIIIGLLTAATLCLLFALGFLCGNSKPSPPTLAERLEAIASQIADFCDARKTEEPAGDAMEDYRKNTMALYYSNHRTNALNAFDEAIRLHAAPSERRREIEKPNGTAHLVQIPNLLRDVADRLVHAWEQ